MPCWCPMLGLKVRICKLFYYPFKRNFCPVSPTQEKISWYRAVLSYSLKKTSKIYNYKNFRVNTTRTFYKLCSKLDFNFLPKQLSEKSLWNDVNKWSFEMWHFTFLLQWVIRQFLPLFTQFADFAAELDGARIIWPVLHHFLP